MLEPKRRPFGKGLVLAALLLALLLLLADVHLARTATRGESTQSVGRATGEGPKPAVGPTLRIQVAGDRSLERRLQRELSDALQEAELPFTTVELVGNLTQASPDPFLLVEIQAESGFWTPLYATRRVEAILSFAYGLPLSQADVAEVLGAEPRRTVELGGGRFDRCPGPCASGQRRGEWSVSAAGLVGLPYMRSLAAERLAQEATALVLEVLPENYNPAKWANRAFDLARQQLPDGSEPSMTFQPLNGCRGGLLQTAASLLIYDADADRLSEPLKVDAVLSALSPDERFKGLLPYSQFVYGGSGSEVLILSPGRMPDDREVWVRVSMNGCKPRGWEVVP